jgi:membrane-bound lytic murein transglycosylase C
MRRRYLALSPLVATCIVSAGCATAKRVLESAEQAVFETGERDGKEIVDRVLRREASVVEEELGERLHGRFVELLGALEDKVREAWGNKEVETPRRTVYVKYTQNYHTRAITNFDRGTVTVETLDDKDPRGSLEHAIVTTLLTPSDPRALDLFSDKGVALDSESEPYLLGLVLDHEDKAVRTLEQARRFAAYLIEKRSHSRTIETVKGTKTAQSVRMAMVPNFEHEQAQKYRPVVSQFAEQYQVSPSLVLAVIQTESNFNPFAVSPAPAYGLMQLVPISGGRDAYLRAKGEDRIPSREYLFDTDNNIELGTAYLNVLAYSHLEQVKNALSREYCVVAAYNTGAGNVFRTFGPDRETALAAINALEPGAVYEQLYTSLPYEETRQYIARVIDNRKQFRGVSASTQ